MAIRVGPGPVFVYEWLTSSRRWQLYALRGGFVAAILVGMIFAWIDESSRHGSGQIVFVHTAVRTAARYAEAFYRMVVSIELTLVLLVAPAATAGAICRDKASGTLEHMLATDLSSAEIVLGKLGVRLIPVLSLIACVVPIMALAGLLGGIVPEALAGSFLTAIACAVLGCSLALTLSVWGRKIHEVLMLTYLILLLWLVGPTLVVIVVTYALGLPPPALGSLPVLERIWDLAQLSNPYVLVLAPYASPGRIGFATYFAFLGVCLLVSGALLGRATTRIRVVAMRQAGRPAARPRPRRGWFGDSAARLARLQRLPGPSLDGNPVLWREWRRSKPSWMLFLVWAFYAAVGCLMTNLTMRPLGASDGGFEVIGFLNATQVTVGLLLLSTIATTSLAQERASGSLDVLLSTPLSTRTILAGKWWGAVRQGWQVLAWPVVVGGLLAVKSGNWLGCLALVGLTCAYGAAVTSLGIALATWMNRAVVISVAAYVLLSAGWAVLTVLLFTPDPWGRYMLTGTPAYGILLLTSAVAPELMMIPGDPRKALIAAVAWTLIHLALAAALFEATVATFDRCLGRISKPGERLRSGPGRPGLGC